MRTARKEIEFTVGALTLFVNCEVDYKYSKTPSTREIPSSEDFTILMSKAIEISYYLDGDEVGEAHANQYYKKYIENLENFERVKSLRNLIQIHCDAESEEIATQDIQHDY